MRLVDDWQWIAAKSYAIRWALVSALLQGATFVVPMVTPPHPTITFIVLAALLQVVACLAALFAAGSRLISQPEIRNGPA